MQVAGRAGDGDLGEGQAAQEGRDGGRVLVPLPRIANKADVGSELLAMALEKGGKTGTAEFFLAFEQNRHLDGQAAMRGEPGMTGLDEGHHLPLVVGGAARDDDLARALLLDETRLEGRGGPFVQGIWRLHVIMTVEQDP